MKQFRFAAAPRDILRTDFAVEWIGVFAVLLIVAFWAFCIRFELVIHWRDFLVPGAVTVALIVGHGLVSQRASLVAEYFLLTLVATAVFGVLSYLSMTTDRPLADGGLLAADRAIGFDWLATYRWIARHSVIADILRFAYNSLVYQGLYFGVLFGILGKRRNLREMFWMVFIAGILTSIGAGWLPALGPFKTFGIPVDFLPVMEGLRHGDRHFALTALTGVVGFPSFHTTMALLYIYGFSRAGAIGLGIGILNILMLVAIPFFGGHYLMDMVGGAGVTILSITVVRLWPSFGLSVSKLSSPDEDCAPTQVLGLGTLSD